MKPSAQLFLNKCFISQFIWLTCLHHGGHVVLVSFWFLQSISQHHYKLQINNITTIFFSKDFFLQYAEFHFIHANIYKI